MTKAETGRHTVIAGFIATALLNQQQGTKGKHYYLALDENLRQEPVDPKSYENFKDLSPSTKKRDARVYTYATDVNKRGTATEVNS